MTESTLPQRVAAEFPGAAKWTYMDVAGRCLVPLRTRQALDAYLDMRVMDGGDKAAMFATAERARAAFARLIGAAPADVAITKNISEGLNAVATSLPWQAGDNVVLCAELEHPNNVYVWHHIARRHGIEVRTVPARDGAVPVDEMLARCDDRTRVATVCHVTFAPGFRTDVATLGAGCRARGILLLVDGAQSVGIVDTDVERLGIDALAVSTQKGLLGLYGMGFLYVRREWADRLDPVYLARFAIDLGDAHEAAGGNPDYRLMDGARRFEIGNYNFAAAAAAEASLGLLLEVGVPAIERHVTALAHRLAAGLLALDYPVAGGAPGPHLAGIVTIGPKGGRPIEPLADHLSAAGVKFSVRRGLIRFSLHLYNGEADVDRLLDLCRLAPAAR